ncbi:hypothetical protein M8818_000219 [Zalaria obscura]|uniref:Uncharacterized protein n=1 Tax=Zalaria obscura TaxID=2024903 RepID=A0ACC3SNY9_9PEZI
MAQQTSHAAHHHYFSAGASTTPHFVARFTPQQQPPHAAYPIPQPTEWTGLDPASTSPRTTFRNEIQGIRPRGHAAGGAPAQEPEPAFSGLEDLPPGAQRLWNEPFMPGAAFTGAGGGSGGFAGSSAVRSTPAVPSVQQAGEEDEWPDISPIRPWDCPGRVPSPSGAEAMASGALHTGRWTCFSGYNFRIGVYGGRSD